MRFHLYTIFILEDKSLKAKIIAWICFAAMIVTITGCKKTQEKDVNNDEEKIKGSYVEQQVLEPTMESGERLINLATNDDNHLEYYTVRITEDYINSTYNCYTLVDGDYQKESVDWANKASSEFGFDPAEYCHGQDGCDYILYRKPLTFNSDGQAEIDKIEYGVIKKVEGSNDYVDVTPADWKKGTIFTNLQVTQDGMLCYVENVNLVFYDPVKQEEVDYGNFETHQDFIIQGDTLYYIQTDTMEIQMVQLSDNKAEKIELESKSPTIKLQVTKEGDINLLDDTGIHQYKKGGTMWETILDGRQLTMSSPSFFITDFELLPGTYDTYYVMFRSTIAGQEDIFATYQFVENAAGDLNSQPIQNIEATDSFESKEMNQPKREITIYSLWPNATVTQAIYNYTQLHKDVTINHIVSITDMKNPLQSDVIRALNTEILGGNGADIILMDGLPLSAYIEKGILMDLSDCLSDLLDEKNLIPNIADNFIQDGKIFCMPIRFYMPIYAMSEDISEYTKSVEDLAAYCKSSEKALMEPLCYKTLVQMFLYTYADEIFSEDGVIMEDRLLSFLSSMNEIAKQTGATEDGSTGMFIGDSPSFDASNYRMRRILCGYAGLLEEQDIASTISFIGDYSDLRTACFFTKRKDGRYIPINDTFMPNGMVAINKNTKNEELAKDFVTFLFNEEVQSKHLYDGFPMNEKALTAWGQEPFNKLEVTAAGSYIFDALTVEEKQKVMEEVRTLTKPVFSDRICLDMLLDGSVEYLKGEKTLEQATAEISQKVNLYLSE